MIPFNSLNQSALVAFGSGQSSCVIFVQIITAWSITQAYVLDIFDFFNYTLRNIIRSFLPAIVLRALSLISLMKIHSCFFLGLVTLPEHCFYDAVSQADLATVHALGVPCVFFCGIPSLRRCAFGDGHGKSLHPLCLLFWSTTRKCTLCTQPCRALTPWAGDCAARSAARLEAHCAAQPSAVRIIHSGRGSGLVSQICTQVFLRVGHSCALISPVQKVVNILR
jgi:hypothetical protein